MTKKEKNCWGSASMSLPLFLHFALSFSLSRYAIYIQPRLYGFSSIFCSTKIYFTVAQQQQTNGRKTFAPDINFLFMLSVFSKKNIVNLLSVCEGFCGIYGEQFCIDFCWIEEIKLNSGCGLVKYKKLEEY